MKIIETPFEGLYEIEPRIFGDKRGYFFESFRKDIISALGVTSDFAQDNESFSLKGTLRGLHFQKPDHAQAKLVRVVRGRVLDVAVDIRSGSDTYGKHHKVILDADRHNLFYIPEGFAHGFLALEDTIFVYKCSCFYHKASEGGILWNDEALDIAWGIDHPMVSEKDQNLPNFAAYTNAPAF